MKKNLVMSLVAVGLLSSAHAADDLSSMFKDGNVSGQIRAFYIDRQFEGTKTLHRNATALGGYLKFETADYKGLSFGTAFYTTNEVASSPDKDPSLFGKNSDGYSILGEAYVQYKYDNTTFKGGRQKLDTPLAGSDDARMLPSLFEAYVLTNKDIPNTTLLLAQVTKFAQGSFGRAYYASSLYGPPNLLSATSGYTYQINVDKTGDFLNMGEYAVGKSTDGVTVASATYAPSRNFKAQVWDYYAYDILNAVYGEANVGWNCLLTDKIKPSLSAQVIKENAVGNRYAGDVNSLFAAAKFNVAVGDASAYIAYSEQSKDDSSAVPSGLSALNKATITPWGGMPAYTQGMVTRHQFMAGTKATKVAASYDFKNLGTNVVASAFYTSFDMDKNSGYGIARTATEPGFDIAYKPAVVKNLELKLRGNFPRNFYETATGPLGWDEYRVIANYNF